MRRWWWLAVIVGVVGAPRVVHAQPSEPAAEAPAPASEARDQFLRGTELARAAKWAEALAAFERADALAPHAITTYNIGACERAMGRYTRARKALLRALEQHGAAEGGELPEALVAQSQAFLGEIDGLLAHLSLAVTPADAALAIDGRPLERAGTVFVAGTRTPGAGEPIGAGALTVLLDPGPHVLLFAREGFAASALNSTVAPGEKVTMRLALDRLPATLHIESNEHDALVRVNGVDVGPPPVELRRTAGTYRVVVEKEGYIPHEQELQVKPGERADVRATLQPEDVPITKRWWFWTAAAATVAAGVVVTYVATRPEPEPPPYDGGSTGWVVFPEVARW